MGKLRGQGPMRKENSELAETPGASLSQQTPVGEGKTSQKSVLNASA